MPNILITGVHGYIASALYTKLINDGYNVRATTRRTNKRDIIQTGDINANTKWEKALNGVDVVVHLAGLAHIFKTSRNNPNRFDSVNHLGTKNLAEACVSNGVKRIIYMSSIGVNGNKTDNTPFTENSEVKPEGQYAISKYLAELSLKDVSIHHNLSTVILRPPLVYGPGARGNFFRLLKLVDSGVPLPFKKLDNIRSMIGLTNMIDILMRLITRDDIRNETYLVSDGEDISTAGLIELIEKSMSKRSRLFAFPDTLTRSLFFILGKKDVYDKLTSSLQIDSSKLRNDLGWLPVRTLEEEIESAVSWYMQTT